MIERHSIEFDRAIFNVIADSDRRTITLQFQHTTILERRVIERILAAIRRRFGEGIRSRLIRWRAGQSKPLLLPARGVTHPEYPDLLSYEIKVKADDGVEAALATLLNFIRELPGYKQAYGAPLDRDQMSSQMRTGSLRDPSAVAGEVLTTFFKRHQEQHH
jgi:hypothetical protein